MCYNKCARFFCAQKLGEMRMSLQDRLHARPAKLTRLELFDAYLANLPEAESAAAQIMLRDKHGYPANYVVDSFEKELDYKLTVKNVWDWRKANGIS